MEQEITGCHTSITNYFKKNGTPFLGMRMMKLFGVENILFGKKLIL